MSDTKHRPAVQTTAAEHYGEVPSPVVSADAHPAGESSATEIAADQVDEQKKGFFAYFRTKEFYVTLLLG
jgi:solute carrier family 35 protein F1/2